MQTSPKKKARIAEDTEMRDSGDESPMEDADEEMEEQDGPQIEGTRNPTVLNTISGEPRATTLPAT